MCLKRTLLLVYEDKSLSILAGYRWMFFIALVAITLLALLPQEQVVISTGWDKSNHLLAFFVLILLLDKSYPELSAWKVKLPLLVVYGMWIEAMQWFMPSRFFSGLDIVADSLGLLLYMVCAGPLRRLLAGVEQKLGACNEAER